MSLALLLTAAFSVIFSSVAVGITFGLIWFAISVVTQKIDNFALKSLLRVALLFASFLVALGLGLLH